MEIKTKNFNNILLILIGRLGDYLVTTVFINALRKKFPEARITLIISKKAIELARDNANINEIKYFSDWTNPIPNLKFFFLSSANYDCAIDLNPAYSRTSMWLMKMTKAPFRLAFKKKAIPKTYTDFVPFSKDAHQSGKYKQMADFLGLKYSLDLKIDIPENDLKKADEMLKGLDFPLPKTLIAVHAGNFKKTGHRWPEEKFVNLSKELLKRSDINLFYLLGPGEEEITKKNILNFLPGIKYLPPQRLTLTAAVLKRVSLLICNNTGTLHLAAAAGTPTLSINTRYSLKYWKPRAEKHFYAVSNEWRSCRNIEIKEVLNKVELAVKAISNQSR